MKYTLTKSWSQFGEDRWVYDHITLPPHGVYVDIGAGGPHKFSNSYLFELNGWNGLCVEPNPSYKDEWCHSDRKMPVEWCAIAGKCGNETLYIVDDPPEWGSLLWHRGWRKISVATHTIDCLLKKHKIGHVDVLSIDTEGTELSILQSMTISPQVIIVEYLVDNVSHVTNHYDQIISYLKPYEVVHITDANLIMVRR